MIRPSWIEMLVSSRMRVVAPLAAVASAAGLHRASAQGTPTTTIDADARLAEAMAGMARLRSYRFDLEVENGQIEVIPEIFSIQELDGEVVRPESFRADADLELLFIDIDLEIVTIGDTTWITNPLVLAGSDNELVRVGDLDLNGFNPAHVVNPDRIALPLLGAITQAVETGTELIDGVETTRIEGVITRDGLESLGESFGDASISAAIVDPMGVLPTTVWIDEESLVRRLDVRGQIFDRESDQIRRIFTFRDFDGLIEIDRPA